ncbi:hypothetical protein AB0346_07925 [Nocardia beijingensis]|uniref:hypothetical protein n=1 Tax=Nocardia beijingensis TaxID=95162 RepID=UPI00344D8F1E
MTASALDRSEFAILRQKMDADGWHVVSWGNNYHDSDRYSICTEDDGKADILLLSITPQDDKVHYYLELFLATQDGVGHSKHVVTQGWHEREPTAVEVGEHFMQGIEARSRVEIHRARNPAPPLDARGVASLSQFDPPKGNEVEFRPSNLDLPLEIVRAPSPQLQRQILTAQVEVLLQSGKMQLEELGKRFYLDTADFAQEVDILAPRSSPKQKSSARKPNLESGLQSAVFGTPVLIPVMITTYVLASQIIQYVLSDVQAQVTAFSFGALSVIAIYVCALSFSRLTLHRRGRIGRYSRLTVALMSILIVPATLAVMGVGLPALSLRLTPVLAFVNLIAFTVIVGEQRWLRGIESNEIPRRFMEAQARYTSIATDYVSQADLLIAKVRLKTSEYIRETIMYETDSPWWEQIDLDLDAAWLETAREVAGSKNKF